MGQPKIRSYGFEIIAFLLLAVALSGCEEAPPASQKVIAELKGAIDQAQTQLNELAPSGAEVQQAATKEVGKLYAIDYKVVTVAPDLSATELERQLIVLGQERWECGQPFTAGAEIRIVCRRFPLSYLRLLGQLTRIM